MHQADSDTDNEALVPHTHAVLGLKLNDAEEANMVRRVSGAVLGLMGLLILHFIIHIAQHGHMGHAMGHLLTAAILPAVGYVAVSQRSTKAAWAFHMMAVIASPLHAVAVTLVLVHIAKLQVEGPGDACGQLARPCEGAAAHNAPLTYSEDGRFWRCFPSGLCINSEARCDHQMNCFDESDESGCEMEQGAEWVIRTSPAEIGMRQHCEQLLMAEVKAPRLQAWWLIMSVPMWGLCIFAAYHSLEFYVQLRVGRLAARVNRASADATVFERAGQEGGLGAGDVVVE